MLWIVFLATFSLRYNFYILYLFFLGFFYNTENNFTDLAIEGFEKMNAKKHATLVKKAKNIFMVNNEINISTTMNTHYYTRQTERSSQQEISI